MTKLLLFCCTLVTAIFVKTFGQEKCPNWNDFLCGGKGECISKEYLCDGSNECEDGSDETENLCKHRSCSQFMDYIDRDTDSIFDMPSLTSSGHYFKCVYGGCVSVLFQCDGLKHCIDGSDETKELCENKRCDKRKQFRCGYGACIPGRNVCDNRYHCADRSDENEEACKEKRRFCPSTKFKCDYGACIRKSKKCNNVIDCLDASDESEKTCGKRTDLNLNSSIPKFVLIESPVETAKRNNLPNFVTPNSVNFVRTTTISSINKEQGKSCDTGDPNIRLDIRRCGDRRLCTGNHYPHETILQARCPDGRLTLRCLDGMWHQLRNPKTVSTKTPCESIKNSISNNPTPTTSNENKDRSERPAECGILPPFSPIPWLVGLFKDGIFKCSGTLIGPSLVLTAAHCVIRNQASPKSVFSEEILKIQYFNKGSPIKLKDFASVSLIRMHPGFTGGSSPKLDVALLILKENLQQTRQLSSACLDTDGKLLDITAYTFNRTEGQNYHIWDTFEQTLDRECFNKATACSKHLNIGSHQFCAINKDSQKYLQKGSSGGPYFIPHQKNGKILWTVAGVVSNSIKTSDCGIPHTVFTSVSQVYKWITECGFAGKCN